ncbi:MAG: Lrp/AsnC family transcriptional regulator [Actinobacteria bacterium]|nr:Lrp/AsnC family transcriptional regulator [Actinomycetota bacterium]NBY15181.1 Lrp/AsnC family transcriptional regulator [Actinomycetota bacterium]
MESIDQRILTQLAKDSEQSLEDLSAKLAVPTSTLHQRIKKLEARGVIIGYQAMLNLKSVGLNTTSFIFLTPIDPAAPDDIPGRIESISEIEGCWSVAGPHSYLVKVTVSEPEDLEALLARIRAAANVRTETTVVLSTAFDNRPPVIPTIAESKGK